MPLQHQLRMSRFRIPELHSPIFRSGHHPSAIRRQRHTKYEVLVALEGPDTFSILRVHGAHSTRHVVELPHPDRLVQGPRNEGIASGAESDRIDAVFVALLAFCALDQDAGLRVPNAYTLVQASGSDEAIVGRDGNSRDPIFDLKRENALVLLDVPQTDAAIAGSRGDVAAIGGEVKRINVLIVACELVPDLLLLDIPDLGCNS